MVAPPRSWASTTPGPTTTSCGAACPTRRSSPSRRRWPWPRRSPPRSGSGCSCRRRTSGTPTCWPVTPSPSTTRSGGRFLLGVGAGGDLDSRILGEDRPLKERVDRFHEFTAAARPAAARGPRRPRRRVLRHPRRAHPPRAGARPRAAASSPATARARSRWRARLGDAWATYGGKGDTVDEWFDHVAEPGDAVRRRVRASRARRRSTATSCSTPHRATPWSRSTSTPRWPGAPPSSASPTSSPTGRGRTARMPVTRRCSRPSPRRRPPPLDRRQGLTGRSGEGEDHQGVGRRLRRATGGLHASSPTACPSAFASPGAASTRAPRRRP